MRHPLLPCRVAALAIGIGLIAADGTLAQTAAPPDLARQSVSAATSPDHMELARRYRAKAAAADADAVAHEAIAAEAKQRSSDDDAWDLARDAAHFAQHSREAAQALRDLASLHEGLAARGGRPKPRCCGSGAKEDGGTPPAPAPHDHLTPAPITRSPCDVHPELPACWT